MEKVTCEGLGEVLAGEVSALRSDSIGGWMPLSDEEQIRALHEAGDRALMSADFETLGRIFADDYVQYNESGQAFSKHDVLNNFRTGAIRYPSIVSTGRMIRVFGDMAVVHGSESDEVEIRGERSAVRYVYLDVLLKRNGEWKLVSSQLAKPMR
jgi:ketosteroid isomerase-like protein